MERKYIVYKCLDCGKQELVKSSDYRKDGRVCEYCDGHLSPIGYAEIGVDLSNVNSISVKQTPKG